MKSRLLVVLVSVVALAMSIPGTAGAGPTLTDVLGAGYHWKKKSWNPDIVIEIADRSDGASGGPMVPFPVTQAVSTWDNGIPNVSLAYRWWNCSSIVVNCITAWEDNTLGQGTFGRMDVVRFQDSNGQRHMLDAHVRLNPDPLGNGNANGGPSENATQALKTTCHEFGHALGLAHYSDNSSCMPQGRAIGAENSPPTPDISTVPNQEDFNTVTQLHNHTH